MIKYNKETKLWETEPGEYETYYVQFLIYKDDCELKGAHFEGLGKEMTPQFLVMLLNSEDQRT